MNFSLAEKFIADHGDGLQRARLFTLLHDRPSDDRSVLGFLNLQNADGSFPAGRSSGRPGMVFSTLDALWWLDELGRLDSAAARSAFAWLIDHQESDGSWDERSVQGVSCPPWIEPGDLATITYLTSYTAYWLGRCGLRNHTAFQRSLGYLQRHQRQSGCIEGPLHATWIAAAVFLLAGDRYTDIATRCLNCLATRPFAKYEDSQLAWALTCLGSVGMPRSQPFTTGALAELDRRQAPDGSWSSEDGPEYSIDATLGAMRAFHIFESRGTKG